AQSLAMSISPVREALRRLEALGFVEHVAHRTARVAALDQDLLAQIYEVRIALETLAVRRAASRIAKEHAASARAALDRLDRAYDDGDVRGVLAGNRDFHFTIYET